MNDLFAIIETLPAAKLIELRGTLVRMVPFEDLMKNTPADFLFTSGRANRYNPAGIECVYFSEDEPTARLEYRRLWANLRAGKQPVTTYFAEVRLRRVLDLVSAEVLAALRIKPRDLYRPWRGADSPTLTQLLGKAVCEHSRISAIRYPSNAAAAANQKGCNIVIYPGNVKKPDSVRILGPRRQPLQKWP